MPKKWKYRGAWNRSLGRRLTAEMQRCSGFGKIGTWLASLNTKVPRAAKFHGAASRRDGLPEEEVSYTRLIS